MNRILIALVLLCFSSAAITQFSGLKDEARTVHQRIELPQPDMEKVALEDAAAKERGEPMRYAIAYPMAKMGAKVDQKSMADWTPVSGGREVWRAHISAPGALSIDIGFSNFSMPKGGELYFYSADGRVIHGPYTKSDNRRHKQLWLPVVPGDEAVLEVVLPVGKKQHLELDLQQISYGYVDIINGLGSSLGCNIDAVCPEGDDYREQIDSVARYTRSGAFLCTGALIKPASGPNYPYFLTANHCGFTTQNAPSIVLYWNYQSASCRAQSSSNVAQLPLSSDTQSGAELVASSALSDFALLRLDQAPDDDWNVFASGWDRSGRVPTMAFGAHHPAGTEKRISIENESLVRVTGPFGGVADNAHWQVTQWDGGVTEGGSSGSPLFDEFGRVVGQLHGGATFFCPNADEGADYYGAFDDSWNLGDARDSQLMPWLDPLNVDVDTIDGAAYLCESGPQVAIETDTLDVTAGGVVNFSADVSGGVGSLDYYWDFDADGIVDSDLASPDASFPTTGSWSISLTVSDENGCPGIDTMMQSVSGPAFDIVDTSSWQESFGDGDQSIEPGEVWTANVTMVNNGDGSISGGNALFVPTAGDGSVKATGGPDGFGYTYSDSDEGDCAYDFQDISNGTPLSFVPSSSFPPLDDGGVSVTLGQAFPFYGQLVSELVMSTNGYLSTNGSDSGGDYANQCGIAPPVFEFPGRINPLHDDLIIEEGFYQYFANCPRLSGSAEVMGCSIFQWDDATYFGFTDPPFFDFQAILYDNGEIVYQHGADDPRLGSAATIGILNRTASDGLEYACDVNNAMPDNHAVCILPPAPTNDNIVILNPVQDLGTLGMGGSRTVNLSVEIPFDFPCGDRFGVDLAGVSGDMALDYGYHDRVLEGVVGEGGCDVVKTSQEALKGFAMPDPRPGLYTDLLRPGTAIDMHFYPDVSVLAFGWYAGRGGEDGRQIGWTQSAGSRTIAGQMCTTLNSFQWNGSWVPGVDPVVSVDGRVCITQIDDDSALSHIRYNDGSSMVGRMEFFLFNTNPTPIDYTGGWAKAGENWGDAVVTQGAVESHVLFFYDNDGEPTVAQGVIDAGTDTAQMFSFEAHPPGGVWVTPMTFPVGTLTRTYNNADDGLFSTNINYPSPYSATWIRNNESMQRVTVDVP